MISAKEARQLSKSNSHKFMFGRKALKSELTMAVNYLLELIEILIRARTRSAPNSMWIRFKFDDDYYSKLLNVSLKDMENVNEKVRELLKEEGFLVVQDLNDLSSYYFHWQLE